MAEPSLAEVATWSGLTLLEFGASWCPTCQRLRPLIDAALTDGPSLTYRWVEDGPGRPLGRAFRVKLWPTLVLLRDGAEIGRLVRPASRQAVQELLAQAT